MDDCVSWNVMKDMIVMEWKKKSEPTKPNGGTYACAHKHCEQHHRRLLVCRVFVSSILHLRLVRDT